MLARKTLNPIYRSEANGKANGTHSSVAERAFSKLEVGSSNLPECILLLRLSTAQSVL